MNILLTNDDGVYSDGLIILKRKLEKIANVEVVAPYEERSASSHSLTLHKPLRVTEIFIDGNFFGYATNGTPSDCVLLGVKKLLNKPPDIIISGINCGGNLAGNLTYSGTVSAAMEGVALGIPSFSISITSPKVKSYEFAANIAVGLAKILFENKLPPLTFLNVNVPNVEASKIKGVKITKQAKEFYEGDIEERTDLRGKVYYWIGGKQQKKKSEEDTDVYAIKNYYVSITPVQLDLTDYNLIEELKKWDLKRILTPVI